MFMKECKLLSLQLLFCIVTISFANDNEVEMVFKQYEVVPDVISLPPQQFLKVIFEDDVIAEKGRVLTPTQVKHQPYVEWSARNDEYYTLIMTDPDAPSRLQPKFREFCHWLIANIPGDKVENGETLFAYVSSAPPKGTGLHRYVFLLYKQPGKLTLDETFVDNNSRQNRPKFRAAKFAEKYNLGQAIAGNFYQAEWDNYVPIRHQQLSGGN